MLAPLATYRLQFNFAFGFESARRIIGYLNDLGVSTVYASPVFKARANSAHGYDVVDPTLINPEIGSPDQFDALIEELHRVGMGWLQDFVPNHMAYDSGNSLLMDIFEKGPGSAYFDFFDVVWDHLRENLQGKLIAPFLGGPYGETVEKGEITLRYGEQGFTVKYYETEYPIRFESYARILSHDLDLLKQELGDDHADFIKVLGVLSIFKNLPPEPESSESRNAEMRLAKALLWDTFVNNSTAQRFINDNVSAFNSSADLMDDLLLEQVFRLTYWRVATKEINYQRFFNINELISLRMEDEAVFQHIHRLVLSLIKEGKIDGLRIDHVDGLYDPTRYLVRLREEAKDAYIVVEKILELSERLPGSWPVEGTTGYEFMNYVNGLFVDQANEERFQSIYESFAGAALDYHQMLYEKKKLIIERHLTGDLDNLAYVLKKISTTTRHGIDLTWIGLKTALAELSAVFPVYRTYTNGETTDRQDKRYIEQAIEEAKSRNPDLARELDFIESVLWMDYPERLPEEGKRLWLSFVMRFQQFTSPLMAKGLEDTTFYIFNRLISLNEVGGNPGRFGISVDEFHAFNLMRARSHPRALNATATHDAKRGEDVRVRIDALSELAGEWEDHLRLWQEENRRHKRIIGGEEVPDTNREYFLYQTLIGAYPFEGAHTDEFISRMKDYLVKAAREAKVHTFWLDPDREYEESLLQFTEAILTPSSSNAFLKSFTPFQRRVARIGAINSLSQALLKITSPGVADFYQGSELWDLNLVDPDNRRPVDYEKRIGFLKEIKARQGSSLPQLLEEMLSNQSDGRIKLFTIYRALKARRDERELFDGGEYIPLEVSGERSNQVIAYGRRKANRWAVIAAPRMVSRLLAPGEERIVETVWRGSSIELPDGAPGLWRNVYTDRSLDCKGSLPLTEAFTHFPLCFLIGER